VSLSGDQRALLQLLVVRGKGPGDISSLLDVDQAEVEARISGALETLVPGGQPIPAEVALLLVGQGDPMTRADAATMLDADPELAARAEDVRNALSTEFPGRPTDQPTSSPVGTSETSRPESSSSSTPKPGKGKTTTDGREAEQGVANGRQRMDPRQRRLLSILVSAVALIAIVVAVVLLLGGNGGDPDRATGPTEAKLAPVGGNSGSGTVEFGFAGTEFAANISVTGVNRNRQGDSYALWLDGPVGAFPFDRAKAGAQGVIAGQSSINQAIICFIAADLFTDVKLSRAPDAKFRKALRDAVAVRGGEGPFPKYVGQTILEGPISMPAETKETLVRECGGRVPAGGNQGS